MGAWSYGIFGNDDAGDMSDFIGDFIGIKPVDNDGLFNDCMTCNPSEWNQRMVKYMKKGFADNMDGLMEFINSGYKLRTKRFKDLKQACLYSDEGTFGMVLAALCMNAGAPINATIRKIGIASAEACLADKDRLEDWDDLGARRKQVLKTFIKNLVNYDGTKRVKVL